MHNDADFFVIHDVVTCRLHTDKGKEKLRSFFCDGDRQKKHTFAVGRRTQYRPF